MALSKPDAVEGLRLLRTKLKSGEYDGADIMQAWIAIDELIALATTAGKGEIGRHRDLRWEPCSQGGLWQCDDCGAGYCSPPWSKADAIEEPCRKESSSPSATSPEAPSRDAIVEDEGMRILKRFMADLYGSVSYEFYPKNVEIARKLVADLAALKSAPVDERGEDDEEYFYLRGYRKLWKRFSHFNGRVVSFEDVVQWSGIDGDREVVRERVYTVTFSMREGSERIGGTLTAGQSVAFESGMVFNISRADKT